MDIETVKEIVISFFKNKIPAHIETDSDTWCNGFIAEVGENSFIVEDRVYGLMPFAFVNIKIIERFKER